MITNINYPPSLVDSFPNVNSGDSRYHTSPMGSRRESPSSSALNSPSRIWSPFEDQAILQAVAIEGAQKWQAIADFVNKTCLATTGSVRSGKQCRERYHNHLDPSLKKAGWTAEEERIIVEMQGVYGNKWALIAQHLPGRTDNNVKNRWYSTLSKQQKSSKENNVYIAANILASGDSYSQPVSMDGPLKALSSLKINITPMGASAAQHTRGQLSSRSFDALGMDDEGILTPSTLAALELSSPTHHSDKENARLSLNSLAFDDLLKSRSRENSLFGICDEAMPKDMEMYKPEGIEQFLLSHSKPNSKDSLLDFIFEKNNSADSLTNMLEKNNSADSLLQSFDTPKSLDISFDKKLLSMFGGDRASVGEVECEEDIEPAATAYTPPSNRRSSSSKMVSQNSTRSEGNSPIMLSPQVKRKSSSLSSSADPRLIEVFGQFDRGCGYLTKSDFERLITLHQVDESRPFSLEDENVLHDCTKLTQVFMTNKNTMPLDEFTSLYQICNRCTENKKKKLNILNPRPVIVRESPTTFVGDKIRGCEHHGWTWCGGFDVTGNSKCNGSNRHECCPKYLANCTLWKHRLPAKVSTKEEMFQYQEANRASTAPSSPRKSSIAVDEEVDVVSPLKKARRGSGKDGSSTSSSSANSVAVPAINGGGGGNGDVNGILIDMITKLAHLTKTPISMQSLKSMNTAQLTTIQVHLMRQLQETTGMSL